jgi:hypothetical protein
MDMDLNIENYSIPELMIILNVTEDATRDDVMKQSSILIEKFTKENKLVFADFFEKARDRVLEYVDTLDQWEEEYKILLEDQFNKDCEIKTKLYDSIEPILKKNDCIVDINPQSTNTMTKMIVINSKFIESSNNSDFTFTLSEPLIDVLSISLYSFFIPFTWYNINEENGTNLFYMNINGEEKMLSIESGNYQTNPVLVDAINTILSEYNSTCQLNAINGLVTINLSADINEILFYKEGSSSSKINNNLGYILGFRNVSYVKNNNETTWSIKSESVCNINGTNYMQLMLDDFNKNRYNSNIINISDSNDDNYNYSTTNPIPRNSNNEVVETVPRTMTQSKIYAINESDSNRSQTNLKSYNSFMSDMFAIIPSKHHSMNIGDMCVEFGGSMQNNKRTYFGPVNVSKMHVKLLDDKGDTINLNGNDWSFTLICEVLYQGA